MLFVLGLGVGLPIGCIMTALVFRKKLTSKPEVCPFCDEFIKPKDKRHWQNCSNHPALPAYRALLEIEKRTRFESREMFPKYEANMVARKGLGVYGK